MEPPNQATNIPGNMQQQPFVVINSQVPTGPAPTGRSEYQQSSQKKLRGLAVSY